MPCSEAIIVTARVQGVSCCGRVEIAGAQLRLAGRQGPREDLGSHLRRCRVHIRGVDGLGQPMGAIGRALQNV